jgi:hypothetical protein
MMAKRPKILGISPATKARTKNGYADPSRKPLDMSPRRHHFVEQGQ